MLAKNGLANERGAEPIVNEASVEASALENAFPRILEGRSLKQIALPDQIVRLLGVGSIKSTMHRASNLQEIRLALSEARSGEKRS